MKNIPSDVGDAIDQSMCSYTGFFPKIDCVLRICDKCGTSQYKNSILEKNAGKVCDKSKRFLVKLWTTKTVCKDEGNAQSFLHWKFERCNYEQLVNLLMKQMEPMAEHAFMASWNYVQYKEARRNISVGSVIFVHDFAQNYLCEQQNEVQGLHWVHKQVTIMPTVAHYRCVKCEQLVTHEIVHITEDLKHDAHLVKLFTSKSIEVLKANNVDICKIIEFTDQAPSQYKNKTAFNYLANSKIPTQRNYFGTRHGKSSCDACTGRVKQGVSRLVKSGQAVIDDAQSFYDACVEHLQKPLVQSDKCQHQILTFELHKKIGKRPSTIQLVGIPETRKLHQIGNTGGKVLNFRKFSCCCYGCVNGTDACENDICHCGWSGFDLAKKKVTEANLQYWLGKITENIHNIRNLPKMPVQQRGQINWEAILRALAQQRTFVQLQHYIRGNAIPDCNYVANNILTQAEVELLDMVALHHMPNNMQAGLAPIQVEGDGNCFPRTISYLLFKTENRYPEIRVRIIYEAVLNMAVYLDDNYVSNGAHNFYDRGTLPEQYAQYSDNYNPHATFNMERLYQKEVLEICQDGAYMGIWQIFQVVNVIKRPVTSVHPMIGNPNVRKDLHRTVYCINNMHNNQSPLSIMWTPMQVNGGRPCHFVPLLQVVRKIHV